MKELYGRVYEPPLHDSTSIQKAITKGFTFVDEDVRKANESSSFAKGTRRNSVVGRQRRRSSVGINAAQVGQGVVPREESKEGQSSNPLAMSWRSVAVALHLQCLTAPHFFTPSCYSSRTVTDSAGVAAPRPETGSTKAR